MKNNFIYNRKSIGRQIVASTILFAFLVTSIMGTNPVFAQDFRLPAPGVMVHLSPPLDPPILKGIKVHPDNPFRFDFILDKGESPLSNDQLKDESSKLIKYFLASLTIPEKDLWVNLSPYEKDRIIPQSFGLTEMGRDLLAEDYMLKQITASLIYPEDGTGKKFWKRIYEEAEKKFGTTNIPVNTFNKVWIVPEKAVVYENSKTGTAYVVESRLKVMLEQDYLSLQKHEGMNREVQTQGQEANQLGSQIVREVVIPELTKEVNENGNFAQLRQVYNSLILATWYKKKIKDSILEQVYADRNKVAGINIDDPQEKEKIYQQYLKAFKKGVYNYIKEEFDPVTQETIPRKYFSGGENLWGIGKILRSVPSLPSSAMLINDHAMLIESRFDQAISAEEDWPALVQHLERLNISETKDRAMTGKINSLMADQLSRLANLSDTSDVVGAFTLEALLGRTIEFENPVHELARPHPGQITSAQNIRALIAESDFVQKPQNAPIGQDAYSLRAMPQVHGATRDVIMYLKQILQDNEKALSEGHGSINYTLIGNTVRVAASELADISHLRIRRLIDPHLSGLPAFLAEPSVNGAGLNSAFMIPQYAAAHNVDMLRASAHPLSILNERSEYSTIEKISNVIDLVEEVLAIELMTAAQAIDLRLKNNVGKHLGVGSRKVLQLVREKVEHLGEDRIPYTDIGFIKKQIEGGAYSQIIRNLVAEQESKTHKPFYEKVGNTPQNQVALNGLNVSIDDIVDIAQHKSIVDLPEETIVQVEESNAARIKILEKGGVVYGVNTGFGANAGLVIPVDKLLQLQVNLIKSHASGLGIEKPLPEDVVRAIMAINLNKLAKGYSGVRPVVVRSLQQLLNKNIIPFVPPRGSLGASGDLVPLSHVALTMMGEGKAYYEGKLMDAKEALSHADVKPIILEPKEGLALINGTGLMTAFGALDLVHLKAIHQKLIEEKLDGYTPQIQKTVSSFLNYATEVITIEINSSTDNPLLINGRVYNGANFHGQPLAISLDGLKFTALAIANVIARSMPNNDEAEAFYEEIRSQSHPSSVDSISSSNQQEDHVSMGATGGLLLHKIMGELDKLVVLKQTRDMAMSQEAEIYAKIKRSELLNDTEMEKIIKDSLDEAGESPWALDKISVSILKFVLYIHSAHFLLNDKFNFLSFVHVVNFVSHLNPFKKERLFQRLQQRVNEGYERENGYIYYQDRKTQYTEADILNRQQAVLSEYGKYFDTVQGLIVGQGGVIIPPMRYATLDEIGLDWNVAESRQANGEERYFLSTTADVAKTTSVWDTVEDGLERESIFIYGGIHPLFRLETEETPGWRQAVFPQIDMEIATDNFNTPEEKKVVDILAVSKLIDSLRLLGFSDEQIRIRINDHTGILGNLLQENGFTVPEIREFGDLLNELAAARANNKPHAEQEEWKKRILGKIEEYRDRLDENAYLFLKDVVLLNSYNKNLIRDKFPAVYNRIAGLEEKLLALKRLYAGTQVNILVDTNSFRNLNYVSLGIQADIIINHSKHYAEISGGGCNFSDRPEYYLSGFALGILRIAKLLKENNIKPRNIPGAVSITDVRKVLKQINESNLRSERNELLMQIPGTLANGKPIEIDIKVNPNSKKLIFVAHGMGGTKNSTVGRLLDEADALDASVVRFTTSRHIQSSDRGINGLIQMFGEKTYDQELEDYRRVIQFVLRNSQKFFAMPIKELEITLIGTSMGGVSSVVLSSEFSEVKKIILVNSGYSFNQSPNIKLVEGFPPQKAMEYASKQFQGSVLVVRGSDDQIVTEDSAKTLAAMFKNGQYVELNGMNHSMKEDHVPNIILELRKLIEGHIDREDSAMIINRKNNADLGGIDFTSNKTPLEIRNGGEGSIKFKIDPAMLQQLQNAPGFVPVIIHIQPLVNLRKFLGVPSEVNADNLVH